MVQVKASDCVPVHTGCHVVSGGSVWLNPEQEHVLLIAPVQKSNPTESSW